MQDQFTDVYVETVRARVLDREGRIAGREGGGYRADATAWAAVALQTVGREGELLEAARARLAAQQSADGRVCLSPQHPDTFWLTPLAIFAWYRDPGFMETQIRAIRFLLTTTGLHWKQEPNAPSEHDPALLGWPWIAKTHSWVEPTALAVMALRLTGWGEHERVKEAVRLLLNRQLPKGGWNYGNTKVFGQELFPFPESTGLALNALKGMAPQPQIQKSLDYLKTCVLKARTPLALGWGLMGLASWGEGPSESRAALISECLERQKRYGPYDTASLSLLLVASRAPQGLESIFTN